METVIKRIIVNLADKREIADEYFTTDANLTESQINLGLTKIIYKLK